MYSKLFLTVAIAACTALPATAQTFVAENGVKVKPMSGGSFEVEPDSKFGVPGQWCAAADYSRRVLSTPWGNRLYVQGTGTASRSIVFGADPAGAEPSSITIVSNSAKTPGANFSVQRAYAFCYDNRQEVFDLR
ncbi:MAG: glycine/D-amino acid oxidase-like deaminating enzyme [Paracoccaceae bacterium]|jgi:glycine/D-amino acid oxidase-like deaminating enzyme|tara:strand:+ start:477 stop:878 length:402 start_codon:yes stop_codon:yes gene_type:complete